MNQKHKFSWKKKYIAWGLTALIVICLSISFFLILTKMPSLKAGLGKLTSVLMPILLGCAMAYLLLPVYNFLYGKLNDFFQRKKPGWERREAFSKGLSTILSIVLLVVVVVGLCVMAGPQVVQSVADIISQMPDNLDHFTYWITVMLQNYPEVRRYAMHFINEFETTILSMITNYIMPSVNTLISSITNGVISVLSFLFDLIIGLIVCVYVLNSKQTFAAQAKKLVYSIFPVPRANRMISDADSIHRIFSGFISGKILDSLIIGMITFVVLSIMRMPYAVMVSVVVGVTNVIPFFGPFIGAIPSAVIIFTASPIKSLYFVIYIIIIQQIDGNIIGPKILGNSTGLPSFWVLFSILVGGGLFGFVGMLLGVPVFATIFMFLTKSVERALERRGLPKETDCYRDVTGIPIIGNAAEWAEKEKPNPEQSSQNPSPEQNTGKVTEEAQINSQNETLSDRKEEISAD